MISKILTYLKSAYSEANGTGSSTRIHLLLLTLGWILLAIPVVFIKDLHQYFTFYLGLYASQMTAYIVGKNYKDNATKDSAAQSIPPSPIQNPCT